MTKTTKLAIRDDRTDALLWTGSSAEMKKALQTLKALRRQGQGCYLAEEA